MRREDEKRAQRSHETQQRDLAREQPGGPRARGERTGTSGAPTTICHRVRIPRRTRNAPECRPCAKRRAAIVARPRVVGEPRRRAGVHDERSAQLAKAGVGLDFPERFADVVPRRLEALRDHRRRCRQRSRGPGPSDDAQPGRISQIEGGAAGRRRPGKDVERAANAGRTRPNAVDQTVRPLGPDAALGDGERDDIRRVPRAVRVPRARARAFRGAWR